MKTIPLSRGMVAMVDDEDYRRLSRFKWFAYRDGKRWYAHRNIRRLGKWTTSKMHNEIVPSPQGKELDHRDRNGLNNQKYNLRPVTRSQNRMNSITPGNKHGFKGIFFDGRGKNKPYSARVRSFGRGHSGGYFFTAVEAAAAYNKLALKYFGEYANLNTL